MKMNILAMTQVNENPFEKVDVETSIKKIGGLAAGICYSSKPFFETLFKEDLSKSASRYDRVVATGHNIGNHTYVTVVIEGISKMMAMILNSFTFYNTSERSGRYTQMGDSPLYNKWKEIFINRINEEYPDMNDPSRVSKLAMENARYVLPIFQNTTTMAYTTGTMELNYICRWFERFVEEHEFDRSSGIEFTTPALKAYFYHNLFSEMKNFISGIKRLGIYLDEPGHKDNKDRELLFFEDINTYRNPGKPVYELQGRSYNIEDIMSFPAFADLLRHRTYDSTIIGMKNLFGENQIYVPKIIRGTEYESAWLQDLGNLSYIPQAQLITIRETGRIDKFVLKAKERLCSRVQLEVLDSTKIATEMLGDQIFYGNSDRDTSYNKDVFLPIYNPIKCSAVTKCQSLSCGCKEPCSFGASNCFNRKI